MFCGRPTLRARGPVLTEALVDARRLNGLRGACGLQYCDGIVLLFGLEDPGANMRHVLHGVPGRSTLAAHV